MLLSFLRSVQRRQAAARNHRILSALDDDVLRDIGLDRRTLREVCETGPSHGPAPESQAQAQTQASWAPVLLPGTLGTALR